MEMSKWVGLSVKSNGKIQICGIVEGWCCMKDNMLTSQQCVRCSGSIELKSVRGRLDDVTLPSVVGHHIPSHGWHYPDRVGHEPE